MCLWTTDQKEVFFQRQSIKMNKRLSTDTSKLKNKTKKKKKQQVHSSEGEKFEHSDFHF